MRYLEWILAAAIAISGVCGSGNVSLGAEQQRLEKSVVMIRSATQDFDYVTPWKQTAMKQGIGSGFVIAGDRVLTNAHNVSNNKYLELKSRYSCPKNVSLS